MINSTTTQRNHLWKRIASSWSKSLSPETEPVPIEEVLQLELAECLVRAGVTSDAYEARFTRAGGTPANDSGPQEYIVWMRPSPDNPPSPEVMLGLESHLGRRLRTYGIRIRALYWRMQGAGDPLLRSRTGKAGAAEAAAVQ